MQPVAQSVERKQNPMRRKRRKEPHWAALNVAMNTVGPPPGLPVCAEMAVQGPSEQNPFVKKNVKSAVVAVGCEGVRTRCPSRHRKCTVVSAAARGYGLAAPIVIENVRHERKEKKK